MTEDTRGPRERVYDEEITPLVAKILEICKRAEIPMIADFELDPVEGEPPETPLKCTSMLISDETTHCPNMKRAARLLSPKAHYENTLAITEETSPSGDKKITVRKVS